MTIQIIELNRPSRNGRIYTWENFAPFADDKRPILGEVDTDEPNPDVSLEKVAFTVSNLRPEDNWLVGDMKVLSTPAAINYKLQELIDNDALIYGPRGLAKVNDDGTVHAYQLISIGVGIKQ